jgi:hypothetical protein
METDIGGGTFSISDAPLNASIGHKAPADRDALTTESPELADILVFIDLDGDDAFTPTPAGTAGGGDIPASQVTTTTANFDLTADDLGKIMVQSGNPPGTGTGCGGVNIIITASGTDEIKTLDVAPTGTLNVTFKSSGSTVTYPYGKLNHIKRNGSLCVLYNIPGPNSIENANIRITNKSATPDGSLRGTLRLPDGTEIFTNYDILTAAGLPLIGANQTLYFNTDVLNTIAQSASNPNGAWTDSWSRAILRLETNLDDVEMMALIRDDDVMGAPLMNMSTGASGNGCGR